MSIKNFKDLKSKSNLLEKLQHDLKQSTNNKKVDDRFWNPTRDKDGTSYAVIRFLPPTMGEDSPYQKIVSHAWQGENGKWYNELCPSSIGLPCPVCEENSKLWATKDESQIAVARKQKKNTRYVANIYVVKDAANPEAEGKVFLYRFGTKIFEKIKSALVPEYEDDEAVDVFNFWEGANFKLKIAQVGGFANYDKSEFSKPSAISQDDEEIEAIWKSQHSLADFVSPDKFKSYEDLNNRFKAVTEGSADSYSRTLEESIDEARGQSAKTQDSDFDDIFGKDDSQLETHSNTKSTKPAVFDEDLDEIEKLLSE